MDATYKWLDDKFKSKPVLAEANKLAMKAGYAYCDATEAFQVSYEVPPAKLAPGIYRNISGNTALALGFVAASQQVGPAALPGQLPDHARLRHPARALDVQGVRRDHVPGRGRDRGGDLGDRRRLRRGARHHHHLGPGHGAEDRRPSASPSPPSCRSSSATSSAAGRPPACRPRPSRPTCCRRCSAATPRRRCRCSPPSTPGDCFWVAIEASRIAVKYMVPVIVLSDGYLANGAEPWKIPTRRRAARVPGARSATDPEGFLPYLRDPETLARPWAVPARRASSTASAASRSRTSPATSTTSRSTTSRWCGCARPRWRRSSRTSRTRCPRAIPTATCCSSAGARPTAPSPPPCARSAARAGASATSTCAT